MKASNGTKECFKMCLFCCFMLNCIYKLYLFKMILVIKGRINNTTARKYRYELFRYYNKFFSTSLYETTSVVSIDSDKIESKGILLRYMYYQSVKIVSYM